MSRRYGGVRRAGGRRWLCGTRGLLGGTVWLCGTTKGSSTSNDCSYDTRYIRGGRPKMGQVSSTNGRLPALGPRGLLCACHRPKAPATRGQREAYALLVPYRAQIYGTARLTSTEDGSTGIMRHSRIGQPLRTRPILLGARFARRTSRTLQYVAPRSAILQPRLLTLLLFCVCSSIPSEASTRLETRACWGCKCAS